MLHVGCDNGKRNKMLNDEWCRNASAHMGSAPGEEALFIHSVSRTKSSIQFAREGATTARSVILLAEASTVADNAIFVARSALEGKTVHPPNFDPRFPLDGSKGPFNARLNAVSKVVFEMALVRIVDNMTTYFSEIVRECLTARPELLRSKEVVTLEVALGCESIEELRALLIDRKVDELAYAGFPKLSEWMGERLGVKDLDKLPARGALLEVLELRNCIVHNRGRVSPKFLRVTGSTEHQLGQQLSVDVDSLYLAGRAAAECVKHINDQVAVKFGILVNDEKG